jgi:magnesium transporter
MRTQYRRRGAATIADDDAVDSRAYRQGHLVDEGFGPDRLGELLADASTVVWLDLHQPSRHQLEELCVPLGLHELAVEDALEPHQRAKVDHYDTHVFLATQAVHAADGAGLRTTEVDVFLGERWLVTVRKGDGLPVGHLARGWDESPALVARGVAFLLYGLLDALVDGYSDVLAGFEDYYDEVSERIFAERPIELSRQRSWFEQRRELARFHRLAVQLREAVSSLLRREHAAVGPDLVPYFQDVYDHVLVVTEQADALRDLVATIVDTNVALRDIQLNQVMKKLTGWAAIVAVPTLVTGFYGMNVPFPGSGERAGLVTAVVLLAVLSGGLYLRFKRKDWL